MNSIHRALLHGLYSAMARVTPITMCIDCCRRDRSDRMALLRHQPRATHRFDLRHKANHRIKIVMQALEIQRMRMPSHHAKSRANKKGCDSNWSWCAIAECSEMPTPQAFLAYRNLSPTRFVMARLAESA